MRRVTIKDVAREAGVSFKTVSRVVNGEPRVSAETAAAVETAIRHLGFKPNDLARSLRQGHTSSTLGLVTEDIANPFYSQIARGVEEVAHEHGFMLVSGSSEEHAGRERELIRALVRRRVDALLIVPARGDHAYLRQELDDGTPAVFVDRPPINYLADTILLDNRGGARAAVEHLIRHGHRRIGLISGFENVHTGAERYAGYEDALHAANLPVEETLVRVNRHDADAATRAVDELLHLDDPPTALFTLNNRLTVGALRALWAGHAGLALVGFDDFELADMLPMPVTVIRHDPVEMGRRAARRVFERLNGENLTPQVVTLPVELVPRCSGELPPSVRAGSVR